MSDAREDSALAAEALLRGETLRALALVGRARSGKGLLLRGIAYAQLGDLDLARRSLVHAERASETPLDAARARAALAEVSLAAGDAKTALESGRAAADELRALRDVRNATLQALVVARAEVLLGRLDDARRSVAAVVRGRIPPDLAPLASLAEAETAVRAMKAVAARDALHRARAQLSAAPNGVLARELVALEEELSTPIARLEQRGQARAADPFAIEEASAGQVMLVDACRRIVVAGRATLAFGRRPVLFAVLVALARAWPEPVARDTLAERAFEVRRVNESHRARLRVEVGRLRRVLTGIAEPVARGDGYALESPRPVVVMLPLGDGDETAHVAVLLGDGAAWTAQSLAEHAGVSKRTVQRALSALVSAGAVVRTGTPRDARYVRAAPRIASRMLLLGLVPKP